MSAYIMKPAFGRDDSADAASLIHASMLVNDVVHRYPETLSVLLHRGIDSCVSGASDLAGVAGSRGIPLDQLLVDLNHAAAGRP